MPHPEDEEQDPDAWNPEKEKKHEKLLDRAMELMEKAHARDEEHREVRAVGALDFIGTHHQINIRRIKNGFVMNYFEAVTTPPGPHVPMIPGLYFPKPVEVFFKNALDGGDYFAEALQHAEVLAKAVELAQRLAGEQMAMSGKVVGGRFPRAVAPPAAAEPVAAPDDETKRLEDPPPASPS